MQIYPNIWRTVPPAEIELYMYISIYMYLYANISQYMAHGAPR